MVLPENLQIPRMICASSWVEGDTPSPSEARRPKDNSELTQAIGVLGSIAEEVRNGDETEQNVG